MAKNHPEHAQVSETQKYPKLSGSFEPWSLLELLYNSGDFFSTFGFADFLTVLMFIILYLVFSF